MTRLLGHIYYPLVGKKVESVRTGLEIRVSKTHTHDTEDIYKVVQCYVEGGWEVYSVTTDSRHNFVYHVKKS